MVNLTHGQSLLQKVNELAAKRKIQNSVNLTTQGEGSGLTGEEAESTIKKLFPTTRQRINAAKFYLDAVENMNYISYLGGQPSMSEEQKPLIDFSDSNLHVQINLLNSDTFPLIVFIVLNGFFSNLVSLEDCVAKMISVFYDLPLDDRPGYVRKALNNKMPNGKLTLNLRVFHAIDQNGKPDPTGSPFNIASEIRHQLIHDDIDKVVVSFASISLSGSDSVPKLHFHDSFFPTNTNSTNTEMIAFCKEVYEGTVNFVDECYELIHDDLQHSGVLPV